MAYYGYEDVYVTNCGAVFKTRLAGVRHERDCRECCGEVEEVEEQADDDS